MENGTCPGHVFDRSSNWDRSLDCAISALESPICRDQLWFGKICFCSCLGCWSKVHQRVLVNYYILQNSWFVSIVDWLILAWTRVNIVKGLRILLHPPELIVWINCGLDNCSWDNGWMLSRVWGKYYILQKLWFGSTVAWIVVAWTRVNVAKGLKKVLQSPERMVWLNDGLDSCGLDEGWMLSGVWGNHYITITHGLDQLWLGQLWLWPGASVIKGLRKGSPPSALLVLVNCGLDIYENCHPTSTHIAHHYLLWFGSGDESHGWGIYYILQNSWLG